MRAGRIRGGVTAFCIPKYLPRPDLPGGRSVWVARTGSDAAARHIRELPWAGSNRIVSCSAYFGP